jgi:hypothetical protein
MKLAAPAYFRLGSVRFLEAPMKFLFLIFIFSLSATLSTIGHAEAAQPLPQNNWVEVTSQIITTPSPDHRDILIHHPGIYSEVRLQIVGEGAYIDDFDYISQILWGHHVPDLQGFYTADEVRTAIFGPAPVRFIRVYARSVRAGSFVHIRVWMR